MTETTIREADWQNPDDCAAVLELIDAYAREPIEGGQPLPEFTRKHLIDGLRDEPGAFVLLAFDEPVSKPGFSIPTSSECRVKSDDNRVLKLAHGSRAVGVAVCFRGFSTFAARPLINVHDLAVLSEFRNRGIGSRLLDAVCNRARETGCCKVTLEVRENNKAAQRLYRRQGFGEPSGKPTRFLDKCV